jgi:endo-beta-N-acetylglucosaminidase D
MRYPAREKTAEQVREDPKLQPYAPVWFPETLLSWNPDSDPDALYNRSRVPLAQRAWDERYRANQYARANQGDILPMATFHITARNPSQGSVTTSRYYAFSYWQYIGVLVFWGGSSGEGLILAPNPTITDAAHRNGVRVYGTVFFPPNAYGGNITWVRDFTDPGMPQKLVQAAQYFGFDGWFINQETDGGNSDLAESLQHVMTTARELASQQGFQLGFAWYDAMTSTGSIFYQNELNDSNDMFFQDSGNRVSDCFFANYDWSQQQLADSAARAQGLGRSGFDVYAGINVQTAPDHNLSEVFPPGVSRRVSAGIYWTNTTFNSEDTIEEFYQKESAFWVGSEGDPSKTPPAGEWLSAAPAIAERTPVTTLPFATSFNTGQGLGYTVDGQQLYSGEWNNLGLQDVLPTYRWTVTAPGASTIKPSLDLGIAYNGGCSLRLAGAVDQMGATVRLYQTSIAVTSATTVLLTYKAPAPGPVYLQVAVMFEGENQPQFMDLPPAPSVDWQTAAIPLGLFVSRRMVRLDLRIMPPSVVQNYALSIGQLVVLDQDAKPGRPGQPQVRGFEKTSDTTMAVRLFWPDSPSPVRHYNVYRRNPDGSRTYLGGSTNNAYFVPNVTRAGMEAATTLDVEAVGPTFFRSEPASVSVSW